jgi:hypothetical protein
MMQRVLTKYGLVLHIAVIVFTPVLVVAQSRSFVLLPLLWLSLIALEAMVLLPSVRRGETLSDARQRVLRALSWDPFLYIALALVGVVFTQWCNSGCKLSYLSDADVWQFSPPPVAWLPFSVEASPALTYVAVFSACAVTGIALRVAVSKSAKRLLLQGLAGFSGLAAVWSVWQSCQGVAPAAVSAVTQGAAAQGTFFGFWMVVGLGVFVEGLSQGQRGMQGLFLLAVVGNLLGLLFFATAIALAGFATVLLLLFIYGIVYLRPHVPAQVRLKLFLASFVTVACTAVVLVFVFPENPVLAKMKGAFPFATHWDALISVKNVRTAAAWSVWKEHPWVGAGADGFRHFVGLAIAGKEWRVLKADPSCVYNDSVQFLCEFGVLGAGLLLSAVIALMVPICYRARLAWKRGAHDENEGRVFLLRLSPVVLTGVLATFACFAESWIASPFRSHSLLLSWVCVMAALPAFLPTRALASEPRG